MERKRRKEIKAEQCSGLLDKPGPDLREPLHVLNGLRDIPYLACIDHEHIPRWPCVLSFDAAWARGFRRLVGSSMTSG